MAKKAAKVKAETVATVEFVPDAIGIRTTDKSGKSYGGFQWPMEVGAIVECPDWKPDARCGNGLHCLADGIGDWCLTAQDNGALWWVVEFIRAESVDIDGSKVKVPRCRVKYFGDFAPAMRMVQKATVTKLLELAKGNTATGDSGHAAATGDSGHAAATGDSGHAAATGDRGHAAATGYSGHAAATGYSGHAAATGDSGHAAATGDRGHAAATGDRGHAAATGDSGHAAATGDSGHAAATGDSGHAAATGDSGHAAATGYSGHAAATGYSGHAAATGYRGHAAATGDSGHAAATGKHSIAASLGPYGTASGALGTYLVLAHYDTDDWPYTLTRVERFKVGEDGVEPNVSYRLSADGKPVAS